MGVHELLLEYVQELPTAVKKVLIEAIIAEQSVLDLDKAPRQVKDTIKDAIEREARRAEAER